MEEEGEHGTHSVHRRRLLNPPRRLHKALFQRGGPLLQKLVGVRPLQGLKRGDARRNRQGVAGQGARLVHGTQRGNLLHDLPSAAVGAHGEAPTDDLAKARQVRRDAVALLGAAIGHPEAGDHLIEDEQGVVAAGELPKPRQEPVLGRNDAHVASHRLDDHAGNLSWVRVEQGLHGGQVVVVGQQRLGGVRRRHAGAVRHAEGGGAGARLHQ